MSKLLVAAFLIISSLFFPVYAFAEDASFSGVATKSATEPVDSYSLFWPISAGKTMGERFYNIKLFKEAMGEFLSFGNLRKSEYNVRLSEKRTVEAEKLLVSKKDYQNATKTLEQAKLKREKALNYIKKAQDNNQNPEKEKGILVSSLDNQSKLLSYLQEKVPTDQQLILVDSLSQIDSILSQIK